MKTAPATRSGCPAASSSARCPPSESETTTARAVPVASITASASAANSRSSYPATAAGRSERPLPRPSKVTTRPDALYFEYGDYRIEEGGAYLEDNGDRDHGDWDQGG